MNMEKLTMEKEVASAQVTKKEATQLTPQPQKQSKPPTPSTLPPGKKEEKNKAETSLEQRAKTKEK